MARPILVGIAGDSGAGKTTLTRGLVRILGEGQVAHVSADHYHRYDRRQRAQHGLTPLNPACNHLDILEQHLRHLRAGEAVLAPVYRHQDGTFGSPAYLAPRPFTIVEGLLALHAPTTRELYDVRVFLEPPEDLRRKWKVTRDCSRRGYTTDQVLEELDQRGSDADAFVRPQRHHADLVIAFHPGDRGDPEHLDVKIAMRPGVTHPELTAVVNDARDGAAVVDRSSHSALSLPGTITPERCQAIEEAIWQRMHFASHLRTERLGEFTVGTELYRSGTLAITQLLVLYQLVTARAALAVGGEARTDRAEPAAPAATDSLADEPPDTESSTAARKPRKAKR
jgi:phosphoribulokinase